MARRRSLRPDEEELWQSVARSVTPRPGMMVLRPIDTPAHAQPLREDAGPKPEPKPLSPFRLGEKVGGGRVAGHEVMPPLSDWLAAAPLQMDAKTHGKMTRGKLAPEARLDLHGMTLSEAHPELIRFILSSQDQGLRLVLVITGKGSRSAPDHGPIPQRQGALRHQVPHWLRQVPLGPVVLQVSESHLRHGGSGAYYVYLRKR
jgi:DNA-nicking Smr family endonuclease